MKMSEKDYLFIVIISIITISLFIFFPKKINKASEIVGDIIKLRISLISPDSTISTYGLIIETIDDIGDLFEDAEK